MDYHFVPNLTIGLPVVQSLRKATTLPFDCHLMIEAPERWAIGYAEAGAYNVTFHVEAADRPGRAGAGPARGRHPGRAGDRPGHAGRAVPRHPAALRHPADHDDQGRASAARRSCRSCCDKVRAARRHVDAGHLELRIEVDGGIDERHHRRGAAGRCGRVRRGHGGLRRRRPGGRRAGRCGPGRSRRCDRCGGDRSTEAAGPDPGRRRRRRHRAVRRGQPQARRAST